MKSCIFTLMESFLTDTLFPTYELKSQLNLSFSNNISYIVIICSLLYMIVKVNTS